MYRLLGGQAEYTLKHLPNSTTAMSPASTAIKRYSGTLGEHAIAFIGCFVHLSTSSAAIFALIGRPSMESHDQAWTFLAHFNKSHSSNEHFFPFFSLVFLDDSSVWPDTRSLSGLWTLFITAFRHWRAFAMWSPVREKCELGEK